ncbi:hypothetical protein K445DRAFT_318668 [Daldinia sp. EC12]|nr:hypothetical protein K445DRAFT_318668 [Daldinia sp. EC12]
MVSGIETMDEDITGVESWRRTRLGDEPIYCAAPPPSNPDDIICLGSDEELDDAERISKRLRYEAQALRYLQGKPVRILSASLHGPFDGASGWKNPWLPKQPPVKIRKYPVVRKCFHMIPELSELQFSTTSSTDNPVRCHLPSPESSRGLQFSSDSLETEKHNRIQAWTKEVSKNTVLERDAFWAPNQVLHDDNGEPRKKRPLGKEWLRKTSKRKKLSSSQNANTKFTPIPLHVLPMQAPTRSTSAPISIHRHEKLGLTKLKVNHSFELATPSSTISQKRPEGNYEREAEVSMQGETIPLRDDSSNGIRLDAKDVIERPTSTAVASTHEQVLIEAQECELASDPERMNHSNESPGNPIKQEAQVGQEGEENSTFESYIDESFYYRARPPKELAPVAGPVSVASIYSKLTQTGTPDVPRDEDTTAITIPENLSPLPQTAMLDHYVDIEPRAIAQASVHLLESMRSRAKGDDIEGYQCQVATSTLKDEVSKDQIINGCDEEPHKCNGTIGRITLTDAGPCDDPKTVDENRYLLQATATGISTLAETTSALRPEDKVAEYNVPDVVIDNSHVPHVVFGVETKRSINPLEVPAVFETHPTEFSLLADEGSTLIGDPMDFNRAAPTETNGLLTLNHVSNNADTRAEAHNPNRDSVDIARRADSDSESNPVLLPLSQLEWGIGDDNSSIPVANGEEALKKDTSTETTLLNPLESLTQNLWVSGSPSAADLTTKHIKLEPVEGGASCYHYPYQTVLPGSQTSGHEAFKIEPSQQSPWAKEILDLAKSDKRDLHSPMVGENAPTNALLAALASEESQSPWPTTDISMMAPSECLPVSSATAIFDKGAVFPHLQTPISAQESDSRLSEHGANTPATPPRMPIPHMRSPDLENSIKPFSLFNTPSPKRRRRNSTQHLFTGRTIGILSNAAYSNSRANSRCQRRVSFAPLPNEDNMNTSPVFNTIRAASPPPQTLVNAGDEDVDNQFQGHFDAMKLRTNDRNDRLRLQPRLLPSPSEQKPASPHIGAMAEAFREADAYVARTREDLVEAKQKDSANNFSDKVAENIVEDMADIEQSPWRKESQGIDHVADVLENLDDFLDAWDVNVELQKARQESSRDGFDGEALW